MTEKIPSGEAINVILPRFISNNKHWRRLTMVLRQDYERFNIVIGCNPKCVDEIINYINVYRYENETNLNKVIIVSDKEEFEREKYINELRKKCDGKFKIIVGIERMFKNVSVITDSVNGYNAQQGEEIDSLQKVSNPLIIINRPIDRQTLVFETDTFKERVMKARNDLYKYSRFKNILIVSIFALFFIALSNLLRTYTGQAFDVLSVVSAILAIVMLVIAVAQIIINGIMHFFDRYLKARRARG